MIDVFISALVTIEALGEQSDWAFTGQGNAFWQDSIEPDGGLSFDGPHEGDTARLALCAVAVLDSVIPINTPCRVTLTNPSDAGHLAVTLRDGEPVIFIFPNGGSEVTETVTSGDGSGLEIGYAQDGTQSHINRVRIIVEGQL